MPVVGNAKCTACFNFAADVEIMVSEIASKISLSMVAGNLTETEALESLDFIPPTRNQYVLVACGMTCIPQLLAQVVTSHIQHPNSVALPV